MTGDLIDKASLKISCSGFKTLQQTPKLPAPHTYTLTPVLHPTPCALHRSMLPALHVGHILNLHHCCWWVLWSHMQGHFHLIHWANRKLIIKKRENMWKCCCLSSCFNWHITHWLVHVDTRQMVEAAAKLFSRNKKLRLICGEKNKTEFLLPNFQRVSFLWTCWHSSYVLNPLVPWCSPLVEVQGLAIELYRALRWLN